MPDDVTLSQTLVDDLVIRRQIARFADAAMSDDRVAFADLFTKDGRLEIGAPADRRARGRAAIADLLGRLREGQDFFVQYAQPGLIDIQGDHATARTLCHEVARGPADRFYRNHGMFFDRLVRSGDTWLFASRRYRYFWLDSSPFGGDAFMQLKAFAEAPGL